MDEDMDFNEFGWNDFKGPNFRPPRFGGDYRNNRYNNAYGDYRGGYGPPGFRGPPGPPLGFGPSFGFPPKPMFMWGQGFGPDGPPASPRFRNIHEDRAIKYLLGCGVSKENVRNLPDEFLQYIEPQNCGICGENFDSFAMSRIHYTSKNHLRAQKKWLSQKVSGPNMQKENPLRSRELYCELCNVQITSKPHADSHYAGKLHRAIVDGRKMPKNPMLLQYGMSNRLEQLIRREKKLLKALPQPVAEVTIVKEPKSGPPELYCNICKTAVTCTEQMTMHLNGKKHLNKEKQHILKMMKGESDEFNAVKSEETVAAAPAPQEGEAEAEGDEEVAEVADDANKEDAEDDFDWGDGGGTWDEPETLEPDNDK